MCMRESVSAEPHLQHAGLGGALGFEVFLSALSYRAIFILFLFSTH